MDFEYFYGKQSSQYVFYRIPKQLFTERQFDTLAIGVKLLYGMMINRMELSQKNGQIDERGRAYIYFTVDKVKGRFHCANDKAVKLMKELDSDKGIGLIESVRQGFGKIEYYLRQKLCRRFTGVGISFYARQIPFVH